MSDDITIKHNYADDGTAIVINAGDDSLIADVGPGDLEFRDEDGPIVTFRHDGTVDINPKYTTTEAAQALWRAVVALNPWRQ